MFRNFVHRPGFTLLELMLVIAITAVLAATSQDFFGSFSSSATLNNNAQSIRADLRAARNRAMNGEADNNWGIHFVNSADNYYEIFSSPSVYSDPATAIDTTVYLDNQATFSSPSTGNSQDIVFQKISGTTTPATIILQSGSDQENISVSAGGLIN